MLTKMVVFHLVCGDTDVSLHTDDNRIHLDPQDSVDAAVIATLKEKASNVETRHDSTIADVVEVDIYTL